VADGTLTLRVEVSERPRVVRTKSQRARLWTRSIVSVSLAVLLTASSLPKIFGISLRGPLTAAMLVLYLWIAISLVQAEVRAEAEMKLLDSCCYRRAGDREDASPQRTALASVVLRMIALLRESMSAALPWNSPNT